MFANINYYRWYVKRLNIYTDGGSRGNPGPAAIGIYIIDQDGKEILKTGKQIGRTTNNIAEYTAVIEALFWLKKSSEFNDYNFDFFLDSSLVVNQLNGLFKVKNLNLKQLILKAKSLEKEMNKKIIYHYIPREKNKVADYLVNKSF